MQRRLKSRGVKKIVAWRVGSEGKELPQSEILLDGVLQFLCFIQSQAARQPGSQPFGLSFIIYLDKQLMKLNDARGPSWALQFVGLSYQPSPNQL